MLGNVDVACHQFSVTFEVHVISGFDQVLVISEGLVNDLELLVTTRKSCGCHLGSPPRWTPIGWVAIPTKDIDQKQRRPLPNIDVYVYRFSI